MNICKYDIYFIILLCFIIYLYFNKSENFQSTSSSYQTDIEAIRNLSNIATQLTSNNSLTVPGDLKVTNNLSIGDSNFASGSSNVNGTANGKMLVFDNTFNGTPGQGMPANKIRLHNKNNEWIAGIGLEDSAQTYHTGNSHRFYVGTSASKYGDLAFKIDNTKNVSIINKIATNNLDPNNMPDGWGGGIRTFDIYSSGTIACGPDGKQLKSYLNSSGDGYFAGNVTINGNLKVNGGINTVNGLATTAYGTGWSSIFYKLPTNFSGFFQVFVQGFDTGYPDYDRMNKYLFATGFWIPNVTSPLAPKQDTNANNWTLKVDYENNGGTMGNPVIYLKSSSGGDRIWYSVITYPTPNYEGK
jgi:uncharacterized protein Usg